jgi:hypothetical protein
MSPNLRQEMNQLILMLLLAQTRPPLDVLSGKVVLKPEQAVELYQGTIQINLHGLPPSAEWILGVDPGADITPRIRVLQLHTALGRRLPGTGLKYSTGIDEWYDKIHARYGGVVDLDGLASIAQDGSLLIHLILPPGTHVIVNGDGPRPIYSGHATDDGLLLHW